MDVSRTARNFVLAVALCVAAAARADVVHLAGGGKVEGEIMEETDAFVVVKAGGGKVSIARSQIESIERSPAPPAVPKNASTKLGPHFRVTCRFASDPCAEDSLAAAEAAWNEATSLLGARSAPLERPFDIHVYRDRAEYAAVAAKAIGGRPAEDSGGFVDGATRSAHVVVRPDYGDAVWKRVGAPTFVAGEVAHEATHLVALTCVANGPFHPSWFSEGLAQHVEKLVLAARAGGAAAEPDVHTSAQMAACLRLRRQGLLPDPRAVFQGRLDHLAVFERYAVRWAFFETLLEPEQKPRADKVFAQMHVLRAGADYAKNLAAFAETTWGAAGLDELNAAFRRHVDAFRPAWDVDGAFDVRGGQWIQWTDAPAAARAWRTGRVGRDDYRVCGAFEIAAGATRQVEIDLGRDDEGFVAVTFDAQEGVWISEHRAADDAWRDVEGAASAGPIAGTKIEFEIRVKNGEVRASVAGKELVAASLSGRDLSGPWGVGVHAGTTAVWTGVTVK